ncbi:hypothetical protein HYDPIDRAFT_40297 [Hydnomerulius pinastri MD-312]|uniref:Uncharacterized protein n=1 Tax=Hydnomerulius pinastri MD-312 TaxID=994086 RepID=A0A0C9WFX1_9AGAM|nr:hypothetical protein HYDPIDRAFT_40297 [Hydnomerulius pinastri MD-312]
MSPHETNPDDTSFFPFPTSMKKKYDYRDMRQHMALGSALEDRFDWSINPGPTPQEKLFFDASCDKWDAYIRKMNASQQNRPPTTTQTQTQTPSPDVLNPSHVHSITHHPEPGTSSIPHPSTRLSRSLRVFVAWKPSSA